MIGTSERENMNKIIIFIISLLFVYGVFKIKKHFNSDSGRTVCNYSEIPTPPR